MNGYVFLSIFIGSIMCYAIVETICAARVKIWKHKKDIEEIKSKQS